MKGKHYIMRKLNQEKVAATEERRAELEAKGYSCVGIKEHGTGDGETGPGTGQEPGKQDEKQGTGKAAGKRHRADGDAGEGGKDGSGTDDAGKD